MYLARFLVKETVSQDGGGNDEERSGLVAIVRKRLKLDASLPTVLFGKRHFQQGIVDRNHQAEQGKDRTLPDPFAFNRILLIRKSVCP